MPVWYVLESRFIFAKETEKNFFSLVISSSAASSKNRAREITRSTQNQRELTFDLPHPLNPGTETPSNSLASNNSPPPGPKGWTCPGACPRGMVTGPIKPCITAKPPQAKRRFHSHGQQRSKLCKFIWVKWIVSREKDSALTGLVWDTNMTAVSLD